MSTNRLGGRGGGWGLACLAFVIGCSTQKLSSVEGPATESQRQALATTCVNTELPVWPTNWRTMTCHGAPSYDPLGDINPAVIDAVGTSDFPAVQSAMDDNFVYLRLRANKSVGPASTCNCASCVNQQITDAHGWGYDFDTDGNPATYEFQLLMNGASNGANRTLEFNLNLTQAGSVDSSSEKAETEVCIYADADVAARVRVDKTTDSSNLGGDCDFWITAAFPLKELAKRGINMKAARLVWAGSSAQAQNLSGDLICDNGTNKLGTSTGDPTPMCFGPCCTTNSNCTAGRPTVLTTLTGAMTAVQTTATVVSTAGYPTSGLLVIDNEYMSYTGVTATTFTGVTRAMLNTTAATHAIGATVDDFMGEDVCNVSAGVCECTTAPDSCPAGRFCDPVQKRCRPGCTSSAPQGGSCSTTGDMTLCCDDGNACTTNACTAGKCVFAPTNNGVTCEDYNACTGAAGTETATCSNGTCGSLVVTCTDDGQACTSDICQPADLACVHPLLADGTVCRAAVGVCDIAETCNGSSTACPANGTQPNGTVCSDGDLCTTGETCQSGVCGNPVSTVTCNTPPNCSSTVGAVCVPATGLCNYPNPTLGNPCGAGNNCNCATTVCDATSGAPGVCESVNTCGNGTVEAGEGCDDGNTASGDGCNASCLRENTRPCASGGAGLQGSASCASGVCDTTGGAPGVCEPANTCGNGTREAGEGCDDGNTLAGDNCGVSCLIENTRPCNGSAPGLTGSASCQSGVCDVTGGAPGICVPSNFCPNGVREAGEGCDDGNALPNDGCNAGCLIENSTPCNQTPPGLTGSSSCVSGLCDVTGGAPGTCEALNVCGNSVREAGEGCDDGNTNPGDGCNSTCLIENTGACNVAAPGLAGNASCASGVCDATGGAPGVCEPALTCGNSVREAGEGCDDGNTNPGDGCNATCLIENTGACNASAPGFTGSASCASGVCDATAGAPGVCEPALTCGNGKLEAGEGCDDGNTTGADGCSALCLLEANQPCNAAAPGLTGSASCYSGVCDATGGAPGVCEPADVCGNSVLDVGEGCDDGNTTPGDNCNATCFLENTRPCNVTAPGAIGSASCASGVCDATGGAPGVCEPANTCGNSAREAGEGCDDGSTTSGDGCTAACLVENTHLCNGSLPGLTGNASCASGVCNVSGGAPGVCASANACGNSVLDSGEGCDDGNITAGDGCNASCLIENANACNATSPGNTGDTSCQSGVCDAVGQAAPGLCEAANACGNGKLETGEGCDDGNTAANDGCNAVCLLEPGEDCNAAAPGSTGSASCQSGICDVTGGAPGRCEPANSCGNSVLEAGEGCDDGNVANSDGCNFACLIENARACNAAAPGLLSSASCVSGVCDLSLGTPGICKAANICGNGLVEAGEGCDDGNTTAADGCNATCLIEDARACNVLPPGATGSASCASGVCDVTGGSPGLCEPSGICGNSVLELGEACDDGNTTAGDGCGVSCLVENGQSCNATSPGLMGNNSCQSGVCDTTGGAPGACKGANICGNSVREAGEGCDDGNTTAGDGCSATCLLENGRACSRAMPGLTGSASCQSGVCDATGGAPGTCEPKDTCGNGTRETGEGCDDGNTNANDGCSGTCRIKNGRACGAVTPGLTGNASCESGTCNTSSGAPGTCVAQNSCGNGLLDVDEGCDDGNVVAGDGCTANCLVESGQPCNQTMGGHTGGTSCVGGFCDTTQGMPGTCTSVDTDGDGVPDSGDLDDDNDGLLDALEGDLLVDTDSDGVPDSIDLDSDNDGIPDVMEGGHRGASSDKGILVCAGGYGKNGYCDELETAVDSGLADFNGDKVADGRPADTDGDGIPDSRDLDSDNDGLVDLVEGGACADNNRDGLCDGADGDHDGLTDTADRSQFARGTSGLKPVLDSDGDGTPDFRDLDSDNDTISDLVEGGSQCYDDDKNGVCDAGDQEKDGIVDSADGQKNLWGTKISDLTPDDDKDGIPDFRDLDSDGDKIPDIVEAGHPRLDRDGDGRVDVASDSDRDGIPDASDGTPDQFGGIDPPVKLLVGGGGCRCDGGGGAQLTWYALFALWLLVRRLPPSRRVRAYALAVAGTMAPAAWAQSSAAIDSVLYKPGPSVRDIHTVLSPETFDTQCISAGLNFQYAYNPLVLRDNNGDRVSTLVPHQYSFDVLANIGLFNHVDVGVHLPVQLHRIVPADLVGLPFAGGGSNWGIGDLRVVPRVRLWTFESGFSIGLAAPVVVPTGRQDAFMGGGSFGVQPKLLSQFHRGNGRLILDLGVNLRRTQTLSNLSMGNEFAFAAAGEWIFDTGSVKLAAQGSIFGVVGLKGGTDNENRAVEADLGLIAKFNKHVSLGLHVGRGIVSGYGAPDVRGMATLSYSLACEKEGDRDKDGIMDSQDACPDAAETVNGFEDQDGCPDVKPPVDTDGDEFFDDVDKCVKEPETVNGYEDQDGCPDVKPPVDSDGDGLFDDADKCPNKPEDKDGFEDTDGCPDPDNDKDGILDADDKCPNEPETINGVNDEDGCPDEGKIKVKIEGDKILILEKVYFATNKDTILERSFNLLNQVAATLKAHPEIKRVRIGGHTDSQGNDTFNMDLSQRRAASVKKFLVEGGIESIRLEPEGFGETRPVGDNKTAAGREMNRRVEFTVLETEKEVEIPAPTKTAP